MRRGLIILALLLLAGVANAQTRSHSSTLTMTSGTLTLTTVTSHDLAKYSALWVSDSAGAVTGDLPNINGEILRVVYNPGATAPTDDYDVVLNDADGVDLLNGTGANRDTANTESTITTEADGVTTQAMTTMGTASLAITNAGDTKGGELILIVRR